MASLELVTIFMQKICVTILTIYSGSCMAQIQFHIYRFVLQIQLEDVNLQIQISIINMLKKSGILDTPSYISNGGTVPSSLTHGKFSNFREKNHKGDQGNFDKILKKNSFLHPSWRKASQESSVQGEIRPSYWLPGSLATRLWCPNVFGLCAGNGV